MKPKQIIIMFLSVAFLIGCAGSFQRMNNLKIGMTKPEVIEAIGVPNSISATRISATRIVEYLGYRINTGWFSTDKYYVRLVDGKVESYGQRGDFNLPY